jgi:hypothetical protein
MMGVMCGALGRQERREMPGPVNRNTLARPRAPFDLAKLPTNDLTRPERRLARNSQIRRSGIRCRARFGDYSVKFLLEPFPEWSCVNPITEPVIHEPNPDGPAVFRGTPPSPNHNVIPAPLNCFVIERGMLPLEVGPRCAIRISYCHVAEVLLELLNPFRKRIGPARISFKRGRHGRVPVGTPSAAQSRIVLVVRCATQQNQNQHQ